MKGQKIRIIHTLLGNSGRWTAALLAGLVFTIILSSTAAFAQDCEGIRDSVLRLHILANSDSEEDQALKLAVRDRILELDNRLFEDAANLAEAEETAKKQLRQIEQAAQAEVKRQGYDYAVRAELCHMYFSTRDYESFTLPAGYYDAIRITIGEGKGHNWWCVLYPPLCLPAAESRADFSDVLTPEEAEIVGHPQKYRFSFALVELWEKIRDLFD